MGCRTVANSNSDFWSPHRFMKCCKARSMGTVLWLYHSSVSKEAKHLHSSSELSSGPFWKWDVAAFVVLVIAFLQFSLADLFTGESVHWNPRLKHSRMRYHFTKGTKKVISFGRRRRMPLHNCMETKQILPSVPPLHIFLRIRHIPCGPGEVGLTVLQGLGIGASFSNDHYPPHHHHQWQLCNSHTHTLQCILQTKLLYKKEDINITNPRNWVSVETHLYQKSFLCLTNQQTRGSLLTSTPLWASNSNVGREKYSAHMVPRAIRKS